jgi:hypothetical protein
MRTAVAVLLAAFLLAGCQQPAPQGESRQSANPDRYDRDRELCRAQAYADTKTRRNIDDSRREVFAGNYERYGQTTLPDQMANYGDTRNVDRVISSCMESRGWPQPQKSWWQKIGS